MTSLIFVHAIIFTNFKYHSNPNALKNATTLHKLLTRTFVLLSVQGDLVLSYNLLFRGKMTLSFGFMRVPKPIKEPSQSSQRTQMNAINIKTPELGKSAKEMGNICD